MKISKGTHLVLQLCLFGVLQFACGGGGGRGTSSSNTPVALTAPAIAYSPISNTFTVGTPITALLPSSTGGAVATWNIDPKLPAELLFDTSTGQIIGTPTAASPAANYTVTATNSTGSASQDISITVNSTPTALSITTQPGNQATSIGGSASFTVTASGGNTPYHYQWKHGSTNIGTDCATLALTNVQTTDGGSYTVIVTDSTVPPQTATSSPALLTVSTALNVFSDSFDAFDSSIWACEYTCPTVSGGVATFALQPGIAPDNMGSWSKIRYKPRRFTSGDFSVRFKLSARPTQKVWWGVALWDTPNPNDETVFNEINFGITTSEEAASDNLKMRFESAKLGNDVSIIVDTNVNLYDGTYHVGRLVYDATKVELYFDGKLLHTITDMSVIPTGPMDFLIGPRLVTGSAVLPSEFDETVDSVTIKW